VHTARIEGSIQQSQAELAQCQGEISRCKAELAQYHQLIEIAKQQCLEAEKEAKRMEAWGFERSEV
jgi:multidrug resistance efflux pump